VSQQWTCCRSTLYDMEILCCSPGEGSSEQKSHVGLCGRCHSWAPVTPGMAAIVTTLLALQTFNVVV
jgi:hypothetical protein